tara:strand:- start:241 stop:792 length:552 start_codon:yes stop_codon:yes gene_type:complete
MSDTAPKLTSFDIASLQLELCHLMELAGQTEDPVQLADYDKMMLETYEMLGDSAEDKLGSLRSVSKRIEAELTTISKEIKALQAAKNARRRTIERLKGHSVQLMRGLAETKGITKLRRDGRTFWTVRTWKLEAPKAVSDWPEAWRRETTVIEPDKSRAREELKGGATVPDGFLWEQVEGIRWS